MDSLSHAKLRAKLRPDIDRFLESQVQTLSRIAQAIVDRRAAAFVGTGASAPSGIPTWHDFLQGLQAVLAAESGPAATQSDFFEWLSKNITTRPILSAELILSRLGLERLATNIEQNFLQNRVPSDIHRQIARIPFATILTTNYDRLLEQCFPPNVTTHTWKQAPDILSSLKHNKQVIIKTHGDIGDRDSLVLTSSQYRRLQFRALAYQQCLEHIFLRYSLVFIGASLTDPDLLFTLDSLISRQGPDSFGPHYAIIPEHEGRALSSLYRDHYRIDVVPYPATKRDHYEIWVAEILKHIAGQVAKTRARSEADAFIDQTDFCADQAWRSLVKKCVDVAGATRADLCFVGDQERSYLNFSLQFQQQVDSNKTEGRLTARLVEPNSIIGAAFYLCSSPQDYVYLMDTDFPKSTHLRVPDGFRAAEIVPVPKGDEGEHFLDPQGVVANDIAYFRYDSSVRSELAVPIFSDGLRVGALNIESDQVDAFDRNFIEATKVFAEQAGVVYQAAERRKLLGAKLRAFFDEPRRLLEWLCLHPDLQPLQSRLRIILYEPDPFWGKLTPHDLDGRENTPAGPFRWSVPEDRHSFAVQVFLDRRAKFVCDAERAGHEKKIHEEGRKAYDIRGPLLGIPVFVDNSLAAVSLFWLDGKQDPQALLAHAETIQRMVNLFAAVADASDGKLSDQYLYSNVTLDYPEEKSPVSLRRADLSRILRSLASVRRQRFPQVALEVFRAIRRLRVFGTEGEGEGFAFHLNGAGSERGKFRISEHPYFRFVYYRHLKDPLAHVQDYLMFRVDHKVNRQVGKLNTEQWVTAPIVSRTMQEKLPASHVHDLERLWSSQSRLVGMVAGDAGWRSRLGASAPERDRECERERRVMAFDPKLIRLELRLLDVVTDVLSRNSQAVSSPSERSDGPEPASATHQPPPSARAKRRPPKKKKAS